MHKIIRYLSVGLLVIGLAACDQKKETPGSEGTDAAQQAAQTITLPKGKLSFTLPSGMSDQTGKLGTDTHNMHVYANNNGQQAVIVIIGDNTNEGLDVLTQRLEQQQRSRDPQLQVVSDKAITLSGQPAQQLDTVISAKNQTNWSTVVMTKIDGKLVTLQISLPADNQAQSQTTAENIVNTITLQ
ncbi:DcrB family lipoprotein [Tatumella saanichensis]|uniref:DcrB family lipoprotein n=1 Tax=Tatumella saanichensis TaxID=480813 RepID=UPI0004A2DC06|nr:DcrB family lipoprotein [Tatumella saanichensis]